MASNLKRLYFGVQHMVGSQFRESNLEDYLYQQVSQLGGECRKLRDQGENGFMDRTIMLPAGRIGFLELKRYGEEPRVNQVRQMLKLEMLGYLVGWTDSKAGVAMFLGILGGTMVDERPKPDYLPKELRDPKYGKLI